MFKIQFIPTGHVFDLPQSEAENLKKNFPNDYKILEKNGKKFNDRMKTKPPADKRFIRDLVVDENVKKTK